MKNKLAVHTKSCTQKTGKRFLALLMVCVMIFSLAACGGQKTGGSEEIKPVAVAREPEPGNAESSTTLQAKMNIFGKYTVIETQGDKSETYTVTLKKIDDNFLFWIEEDGGKTTLGYGKETNIINDDCLGPIFHIEFSLSGNTVTGSGYMSSTFFDDEPIEAAFALTKISD